MDLYKVIKRPLITEKANLHKELSNQIALEVDRRANKIEIRRAVETLLKTEVLEVKTLNVQGKTRRVGKNVGRRPNWKKAIVGLPRENASSFLRACKAI